MQLQHGTTHSFDAWGKPIEGHVPYQLAGGYRAVLSGLKGDQQWVKKALQLENSWVSKNICWHCQAGS